MIRLVAALVAAVVSLVAPTPGHAGAPPPDGRLASLRLPGTPSFVAVARDVIDLRFAIDPSLAANAGLFDDADRVPCFAPDTVAARLGRLDRDLAALKAMPWRTWSIGGGSGIRTPDTRIMIPLL